MTRNTFAVLLILVVASLGGTSCQKETSTADGDQDNSETTAETDAGETPAEAEGDDGAEEAVDVVSITDITPEHGPAIGGSVVLITGRNFADPAVVYFGEHMAQPADTAVIDQSRIRVVAPAGSPGSVDVKVQTGGTEAVKEGGFTYDLFYVDPPSGSIAGGTYVEVNGSGTEFEAGLGITFDGVAATEVRWVSSNKATCKTPPGTIGPATVAIDGDTNDYQVRDVFSYFNSADPINGGLGGGPIAGAVNVSVINAMTGDPVEGAFCILGTDGATAYRGLTDTRGQIVFSGPDLSGRQIVTAGKEGFESTTIEEFDARDVSIFLVPMPDPQPGPLPPGRLGAIVSGELVFEHGGEFGPGPWEIIPDPGPDEEKIAYVYGTGWSIWYPPPSSALSGAEPIVREDMSNTGTYGFRYSAFVRPETVAVWALAGIQNKATDTFVPYAFGVTRGVIAGPGEEIGGVLVYMVHELSQNVAVQTADYYPPLDMAYGPQLYKCDLFLDLGGDGTIHRDDNSVIRNEAGLFSFPGWLPLRYELADATYAVVIGAYNQAVDPLSGQLIYVNPFSVKVLTKITRPWETVVARDFIGVPYAVDPPFGQKIRDMHLEFDADGAAPDFWLVMLQTYPDQLPLWKVILPPEQTSFDLPDLAAIAGLPAPPSGYTVWVTYGISSPGFVFDEFSYRYFSQSYWSAYAADAFIVEF